MMIKLAAFLVGAAVLSGAGLAQAADVAQTNTQSKIASPQILVEDAQTPKTVDSQNHGPVLLKDDQMNEVTAGHFFYTGYLHYGWYRVDCCGYVWKRGWHY